MRFARIRLAGFIVCVVAISAATAQTEKLAAEGKFKGGSAADQQLWTASYYGQFEDVKQAMDRGADVNFPGKGGYTSLVVAARNGHLDIVQYLMAHGADINKCDNNRHKTPLLAASFKGQYEVAEFLLNHGADIRSQGVNGWTPLHDAAYIGNFRVVKLLVDHGAPLDIRNERNETPLETAERGQYDAVRRGDSHNSPEDYRNTIAYIKSHIQ